jgi:hypothetical protein
MITLKPFIEPPTRGGATFKTFETSLRLTTVGFLLAGLLTMSCSAPQATTRLGQPPADQAPPLPQHPETRQDRTVSLPGLTLNLDTGDLELTGHVCISSGVLEYIAVATGGKVYESVLSLDVRPSHLHVGLLMGGYVAGDVDAQSRGDFASGAGQPETPKGAPQGTPPPESYWRKASEKPTYVTFDVKIEDDAGEWHSLPIENFLTSRKSGKAPNRLYWAFTGSFFYHDPDTTMEAFAADVEKSVIALWYDPSALFNLSQDVGNPYRTDAGGLEVNASALPRKGTPIRLIIRRDHIEDP